MQSRRHYIAILPSHQEWVSQISPGVKDWTTAVFNDITHGGKRLRIVPLSDNEKGRRIGLFGEVYFCEAGQDENREDSLFIIKIKDVLRRSRHVVPAEYGAEFLLRPSRIGPDKLDSVQVIFSAVEELESKLMEPSAQAVFYGKPSDQLLKALQAAPEMLRHKWGPGRGDPPTQSVDDFLKAVRLYWKKYRLERFANSTIRQSNLLERKMTPLEMDRKERTALLAVFDFNLLNAFVREYEAGTFLFNLLHDLADMAVSDFLRSKIWAAMLSGLDPQALRRELFSEVVQLTTMPKDESSLWADAIFDAISSVASCSGDLGLQQIVEAGGGQSSLLDFLDRWLRRLEFQVDETITRAEAIQVVAAPGAGIANSTLSVELPGSQRGPIFDQWVLGLRIDLKDVDRIRERIAEEVSGAAAEIALVNPGVGFKHIAVTLRELQSIVDKWIKQLPDPSILDRDHYEAGIGYDRACSLVGKENVDTV